MNLDFASVWETVADLVPENDALICGEDVVSWKERKKMYIISQDFCPFVQNNTF